MTLVHGTPTAVSTSRRPSCAMSLLYHVDTRTDGDHFVSNRKTIEKTRFFAIAEIFPKASHLHIHFDSNLSPDFLLSSATQQTQIYDNPLGKNHSGYKAHN
ncbi:hypothetical protein B0T26DRAFT_708551 [Lasiosphaeria miniovina]|uniref:Uncharacterized protein n=1 Tax=Lasiosphaeria miniovina TaxID=1954250 RepID=A0AA40AJV8_9PEZI|nr:uncharacterized protein B0T26DRAFT_708551 [Lasiosphaeria miniovina]KAK0717115.1 hypothetical protein B0T26DRAFT_708551 [Lasiosphaeria miniovina]